MRHKVRPKVRATMRPKVRMVMARRSPLIAHHLIAHHSSLVADSSLITGTQPPILDDDNLLGLVSDIPLLCTGALLHPHLVCPGALLNPPIFDVRSCTAMHWCVVYDCQF